MRVVKVILGLAILAMALTYGGYRYWQAQLAMPLAIDEPVLYEVPEGAGLYRVIEDLADQEVIAATWPYRVLIHLEPESLPQLRQGEYRLDPQMNGRDLLAHLGSGDVVTYSITFPEGWTFRQIREALAAAPKLAHDTTALTPAELMAKLDSDVEHPEGWFFPDTYRYHKGMSDLDILRQSHRRMRETLEEIWRERDEDLPLESSYDALIMASLIERETGVPEERPAIAGVFIRRLERGMRLQTDPTVIYGMGDSYDGNITRADLREETPYNTYVIDGMPPTPIAMPGRGALEAAVNPEEGDALYFVSRGDGSHHFSSSLQEHNAAVRRYILNR
ncbi:endolytic transglycosylase MltG [Aidingimonas lacisalsi]|uniref:endolytic transglycosylase MltG n=1 Tax=Aidingimonas lacisalsi TaxID=2604086 RepID=UPI0011D2B0E7|nr:endolytic transglycosylase MltG [Aidingimonas lacisalsi]